MDEPREPFCHLFAAVDRLDRLLPHGRRDRADGVQMGEAKGEIEHAGSGEGHRVAFDFRLNQDQARKSTGGYELAFECDHHEDTVLGMELFIIGKTITNLYKLPISQISILQTQLVALGSADLDRGTWLDRIENDLGDFTNATPSK